MPTPTANREPPTTNTGRQHRHRHVHVRLHARQRQMQTHTPNACLVYPALAAISASRSDLRVALLRILPGELVGTNASSRACKFVNPNREIKEKYARVRRNSANRDKLKMGQSRKDPLSKGIQTKHTVLHLTPVCMGVIWRTRGREHTQRSYTRARAYTRVRKHMQANAPHSCRPRARPSANVTCVSAVWRNVSRSSDLTSPLLTYRSTTASTCPAFSQAYTSGLMQ